MRDQFLHALTDLAEKNPRIILITADLGFAVFDDFKERFPNQFINVGVAEQNMTLVATGMALEGYIVYTYSIANFSTLRCLEMIRNDAAYHSANVNVVSSGGGFSYGPLGISHHATEDLAIMRSLPDVTCFSPTSCFESSEATKAMAGLSGTCFLRLDKDDGFDGPRSEPFVIGRPRLLLSGSDVAIFTTGGIVSEVIKAADHLLTSGISSSVYSVHSLNSVDSELFIHASRSHSAIVTVEEHSICGGLAALVLETLGDANEFPRRFLRLGLNHCFSSVVGTQPYLRSVYGLDSLSISSRISTLLSS